MADLVVSVGSNGLVASQGSVSEALTKDYLLAAEAQKVERIIEKEEQVIDSDEKAPQTEVKPTGQLIQKEEVAEGRISWGHCEWQSWSTMYTLLRVLGIVKWFFGTFGGFAFWSSWFLACGLAELVNTFQTWWLGLWARQYDTHGASDVDVAWYLGGYAVFIFSTVAFFDIAQLLYITGWARGSKKTHERLLQSVLGTNLRWLDSTPVGRIISRFTQDMQAIDGA